MILAKYGQALTIEFPVLILNGGGFAATGDWTPATGDTKVSKSAGAVANTTNNPSAVTGTGSILWTLTLTATEMQSERVTVQIVDAALEDTVIIIHTYGNASALHAVDLDDSVRAGLTALPAAAADAAGGLPISDAGGLDLDAQIGTDIDAILVDTSTTIDDLVDDLESRLGTPSNLGSGATVAANLVDIEAQTDDIGAAGAGLTAVPWNAAWDAEVQSEANDALVAFFTSAAALVDLVWDEPLADHVAVGSFGQRNAAIRTGTAAGGAAGSITLDGSASATDDFYNNTMLVITGGTGANQCRIIEDYTGATKVGTVSPNWVTTPDATSIFVILPFDDIPGASAPSAATIATAVVEKTLTEGYAADAVAPTLQQALFMVHQMLTHMTVSGTTLTVYKLDGVTVAATFTLTLDSDNLPTALTRTS